MEKAAKAEKATTEIKKMIDIFESNYPLPRIEFEIPSIGTVGNLFNYTWYHLHFASESENKENEKEAFKYHFNQSKIILSYLYKEGLITQEIKPIDQILKPEVLELHSKYTYEEQHGAFNKHTERETIRQLWVNVMQDYHKPQLKEHLIRLKQIINTKQNGAN
jgi:hypothetical protein